MASGGGDGDEENPFSFKKFIKKSSRERTNSDSDWEDGSEDEEQALDLLDTSNHNKESSEPRAKKPDENPFSFKRFLQSSGGPKQPGSGSSNGGGRLATPDLANDLPDFVQDHLNDRELSRSRSRNAPVELCLPDFALDSAAASGNAGVCAPDVFESAGDALSEACGGGIRPKASLNGHPGQSPVLERDVVGFRDAKRIEGGLETRPSSTPEGRRLPSYATNSGVAAGGGGLPDFLSDSGLGGFNVPANSTSSDLVVPGFDGFHALEDEDRTSLLNRLKDENHDLRRQLNEAREFGHRESARAAELVKDVENLRKHEADETAALENMVQQVEANLQTTLQRAINAENVIVKLKQEIKTLQSRASSLAAENDLLRSSNSNPLREKSLNASRQIGAAATNAEQLLRQLLSGVETLKMVSTFLASTDQVTEVPSDNPTDNSRIPEDPTS